MVEWWGGKGRRLKGVRQPNTIKLYNDAPTMRREYKRHLVRQTPYLYVCHVVQYVCMVSSCLHWFVCVYGQVGLYYILLDVTGCSMSCRQSVT